MSCLCVCGERASLGRADGDGDLASGFSLDFLPSGFDNRASGFDSRGNGTIKALKSYGPAHADEMAGNVFITFRDLGSAENGSVVPNSRSSAQFSDLTIVHECRYNLWQFEAGTVGIGTIDAWPLSEESNEGVEVWQHHLGRKICTGSHSVIVSKILGIFVLLELGIGEDSAPWRKRSSDLRLKSTEVRHDADIGHVKFQVSSYQSLNSFEDGREVDIIPRYLYYMISIVRGKLKITLRSVPPFPSTKRGH